MKNKLSNYEIKPKPIHKRALKKLVENGGNVSKAMRDVGYSKETAKNPSKLTSAKGFIQLMDEQGLTDEFLNGALHSDIENKPKNRKAELELAYKLRGRLRDVREGDRTLVLMVSGESASRYGLATN
jgi:hypothetical protein